MYNDLSRYLQHHYPSLRGNVEGEFYPAPQPAAAIAQITQTFQLAMLPLLMMGEGIFQSLGMATPSWYKFFDENKMAVFIAVYLANMVAQNKASTGAFEIEYNGVLVYSKLATGEVPTLEAILGSLHRAGLKR